MEALLAGISITATDIPTTLAAIGTAIITLPTTTTTMDLIIITTTALTGRTGDNSLR